MQCWKIFYVVEVDTWINFTSLPQNWLETSILKLHKVSKVRMVSCSISYLQKLVAELEVAELEVAGLEVAGLEVAWLHFV